MARPGWLNENANRSFPLLKGDGKLTTPALPNTTLVDFGCVMGLNSGYEEGQHDVWLSTISRSGDTFTFTVESDAPGCVDYPLVFTRALSDDWYVTEHVEAVAAAGCGDDDRWEGFLTTGNLSDLADVLADSGTLTGEAHFEPATVRSLVGHFLQSVGVANQDRTAIPADPECECPNLGVGSRPAYWVEEACLTGNLRLTPGYNCRIEQDDDANSITISAGLGEGAGEPCEELTLGDESLSDSLSPLDGSPTCNDVIRSINGIGGRIVDVLAGQGVSIAVSPSTHTLRLNVNLKTVAYCDVPTYPGSFSESIA